MTYSILNSEYCTKYLPKLYKNPKELKRAQRRYWLVKRGLKSSFDDPFGDGSATIIRKIKI